MKHFAVMPLTWIASNVLVADLQMAQVGLPPIADKLLASGIVTFIAVYQLWQGWIRENKLREETHGREERMAARITLLEQQHATELKSVTEAVHTITNLHDKMDGCRSEFGELKEAILGNTAACEKRRAEVMTQLKTLKGE